MLLGPLGDLAWLWERSLARSRRPRIPPLMSWRLSDRRQHHHHDILLLSLTNHPEIQTTFLILRRGPLLYECSVNWANKCIYRKIVQHTSPRVLAAFGGEAAWDKPPLNTGTSLCYIFLFSGCWIIAYGGDPLYGEWGADCFCHCRGRLWRFSPIFLQNAFFIYIP